MNKKSLLPVVGVLFAGLWLAGCGRAATLAPTDTLTATTLAPRPTTMSTATPDLAATKKADRQATMQAQQTQNAFYQATTSVKQTEASRVTETSLAVTPFRTPRPTDEPVSLLGSSMDENIREMSKNWQVAYYLESTNKVCTMKGDGSSKFCLDLNKINPTSGLEFLSWSPDGNRLRIGYGGCGYIWTIGIDLAAIRDHRACPRWGAWSPDGKYIAYVSDELERRCNDCQTYFIDIFIDNPEGTFHKPITAHFTGWGDNLAWSPDGRNLAFTYRWMTMDKSGDTINNGDEEIYVYSLESGKTFNLTQNAASDRDPAWSLDGRFIAFLSNRGGSYESYKDYKLYIMNSDGSVVRKAADFSIEYYWPYSLYTLNWPDSKHILYGDKLVDLDTGDFIVLHLPFEVRLATWFMPIDYCTSGWTRLKVGGQAKVSEGITLPNRVRLEPATSAEIIVLLDPGSVVRVIEGPVCADELVFWRVENTSIPGGVGWTAEGDGREYYLEPIQ